MTHGERHWPSDSEYGASLHQHVHGYFAGHDATSCDFSTGPIQSVLPGFHLIRLAPGPRTALWTYVSVGAGFDDHHDEGRLEFMLLASEPSARHVELLAMTAHYHRTGQRLGVGHTFSIGEPWVPGSTLDCMLVSKPYPFGLELEVLELGDDHVHLLWLLPVTQTERAYAAANGLETLESLFEAAAIEFWDPTRPAVI
jgi:hypothetical protein